MEKNFTTRTSLIIGDEGVEKLKNSKLKHIYSKYIIEIYKRK